MAKHKKTKEAKEKISKSMQGNKNAEKYTEEFVIDMLTKMIAFAKKEVSVEVLCHDEVSETEKGSGRKLVKKTVSKKVHLKNELLIEFEIWNVHWFAEMKKKFVEKETVSALLQAIDMICEVNSYTAAANNTSNPTIVKMNLSTHYGWADNTKADVTQKNEALTDEELEQQLKEYEKRNK